MGADGRPEPGDIVLIHRDASDPNKGERGLVHGVAIGDDPDLFTVANMREMRRYGKSPDTWMLPYRVFSTTNERIEDLTVIEPGPGEFRREIGVRLMDEIVASGAPVRTFWFGAGGLVEDVAAYRESALAEAP